MPNKISALLITYNEENNIQRYLDNVELFADEIIIVDSYSTDKTELIATKHPKVKFIKRAFDNFTNQKNYTLSLAQHDWVTFFDADEELSSSLIEEMQNKVNSTSNNVAYMAYHYFYFKNKKIHFSGQQNVRAVRLFKKSKCRYKEGLMVHELLDCDGEIGVLNQKVKHHTFVDEEYYLDKLNNYSKLRAKELQLKNLIPTFFHHKIKPAYRFFNYFILRFGFLDGKEGFTIAKLHAISVANRYKYLDEIYQEENLKTSLNKEV